METARGLRFRKAPSTDVPSDGTWYMVQCKHPTPEGSSYLDGFPSDVRGSCFSSVVCTLPRWFDGFCMTPVPEMALMPVTFFGRIALLFLDGFLDVVCLFVCFCLGKWDLIGNPFCFLTQGGLFTLGGNLSSLNPSKLTAMRIKI